MCVVMRKHADVACQVTLYQLLFWTLHIAIAEDCCRAVLSKLSSCCHTCRVSAVDGSQQSILTGSYDGILRLWNSE